MNFNTLILRTEEEADKISASPGTIGWVFTFAMAVLVGFLIFDMVRRIRKVRYRDEIIQEISEEQAAIEEAAELAKQRNQKN
jgi:predicted nucleotide-binding protein (sugar kinase/HSP70/actin superfamily)